jgi:hypothetical protein
VSALDPADGIECIYHERDRRCHEPAVWVIPATWAHPAWPFCERHAKPGFHPPDMHKLLPGRITRAIRRHRQ